MRAGFGTFFARFIGGLVDDIYTGQGLYQTAITLRSTNYGPESCRSRISECSPVNPDQRSSRQLSAFSSQRRISRRLTRSRDTVSVERQFGGSMVLTASGIWSHGVNLYGVTDLNAPVPPADRTPTKWMMPTETR